MMGWVAGRLGEWCWWGAWLAWVSERIETEWCWLPGWVWCWWAGCLGGLPEVEVSG